MLKLTSRHWRFHGRYRRINPVELEFVRSLGQGVFGFEEVMFAEYREMRVAITIVLHNGPTRPIVGSDTGRIFGQEIYTSLYDIRTLRCFWDGDRLRLATFSL